MRHPYRYAQAVKVSFTFTVSPPFPLFYPPPISPQQTNKQTTPNPPPNTKQYILDTVTAVAGVLMFGPAVRDEITSNILREASYPRALTVLMCLCIGIIPLTKIPLNARPIVATLEVLLGLSPQQYQGEESAWKVWARGAVRVGVVVVFLGIAVVFPAFDSIMAFMGSALCFTICVTYVLFFSFFLLLSPPFSTPLFIYFIYFFFSPFFSLSLFFYPTHSLHEKAEPGQY